jgi:hypothetical protein
MSFYQRYLLGGNERSVYNKIYALGAACFNEEHYQDVQLVLTETFNRVAYNLDVIYSELQNIGYAFNVSPSYSSEQPLGKPLANVNMLLGELNSAIKPFGHIPESLKLFYKIVGACNFGWDYNHRPALLWNGSDPIQIESLDDVVDSVVNGDWAAYLDELLEDDRSAVPHLELAADALHKDNISGGPPYAIQLTKAPSVDSLFLNEPHHTTFINYLRICFENCGFPGVSNPVYKNDYHHFFAKVKPLLKTI